MFGRVNQTFILHQSGSSCLNQCELCQFVWGKQQQCFSVDVLTGRPLFLEELL